MVVAARRFRIEVEVTDDVVQSFNTLEEAKNYVAANDYPDDWTIVDSQTSDSWFYVGGELDWVKES